jgi:hypothetical protein
MKTRVHRRRNEDGARDPVLIGADAVHGANIASGTVIFPHNAGLGARTIRRWSGGQRIAALEVTTTGSTDVLPGRERLVGRSLGPRPQASARPDAGRRMAAAAT